MGFFFFPQKRHSKEGLPQGGVGERGVVATALGDDDFTDWGWGLNVLLWVFF